MTDVPPSFLLLVTGPGPRSETAADCVRSACAQVYGEACRIEVVDRLEDEEAARRERVALTPTLIRRHPEPERSWVGAFADTDALARALRTSDA
ncbi:MAG: circadian clock KaiB family protein [Gemmatimonadota bacterium]|nr:circadian clock KaiB family protein [Gemmatimonadota bacterium]